jgi:hypothetical protein
MLRKTLIALGAVAVLGAAALAPTSASAFGGGKFGGGFKHKHFFGPGFGYGYPTYLYNDCYWVKKYTPFGIKFVKVCSW